MRLGINYNGDLSFDKIVEGARLSEGLGYSNIWVGESTGFKHPFPVISAIAHNTEEVIVGSGIISYYFNRPLHIKKAFETLVEVYGERFAIALAPGDLNSLRHAGIDISSPLGRLKEAVDVLRGSSLLGGTPIYVGASGPRMIELGSRIADGVLLNYAHPDYIEWALNHISKKTFIGVYAPALLLPDAKNVKAGLMASSFVAAGSNKAFQEEFELTDLVKRIRMILASKEYDELESLKNFLMEHFLISGTNDQILKRLNSFKRMGVDQVIMGSPFTYNPEAVMKIGKAYL